MADIFLSYAHEDIEAARILAVALEAKGWSVFWDRTIPPGRRWSEYIGEQLGTAHCLISLWSNAATASDWVLEEADEGKERGILVPALIEAKVLPPRGFRRIHAADLVGWRGDLSHEGFVHLSTAVGNLVPLGDPSPPEESRPDRTVPEPPQPREVRVHPADGLAYVWIPPGEFDMGCSPGDEECGDDEKPSRRVKITRGFWMGQTPVTQAAWEKVMGKKSNPSQFPGPHLPVDSVTWAEAVAYCTKVGGRLPTEAEWEYAARAGDKRARYGELDRIAWFGDNSGDKPLDSKRVWAADTANYVENLTENGNRTRPVASKDPNPWGLFDTLGNVLEWAADWHSDDYYKSRPDPDIDPKGPDSGEERVLRGGSWVSVPWDLRVSYRDGGQPGYRFDGVGFRCTREAFP